MFSVTNFSVTRPYFFHDDTTWCVSQAKPIPAWMILFHIAPPTIMIMGFFSLSAVVLFTYMFSSFEDHPPDIWSTIHINGQAVVLLPSQFNPKRLPLRYFFGSALLVILAATTTFLAYYCDFMLQPRSQANQFFRSIGDPRISSCRGQIYEKLFDGAKYGN